MCHGGYVLGKEGWSPEAGGPLVPAFLVPQEEGEAHPRKPHPQALRKTLREDGAPAHPCSTRPDICWEFLAVLSLSSLLLCSSTL